MAEDPVIFGTETVSTATVPVVDLLGHPLSPCTPERAQQNIEDGLARWQNGVLRLNYRPLAYRGIYRRVLKRDGYQCAWCMGRGSTMDHVIPLSFGGRTQPDNCVVACRSCNHSRNNLLPSAFLAWTGFTPTHPVILRILHHEAESLTKAEASLLARPIKSCLSKEEAQVWLAYHSGHPEKVHPDPPKAPWTKVHRSTKSATVPFLP